MASFVQDRDAQLHLAPTAAAIEAFADEREALLAQLQALTQELESTKGILRTTSVERDLWKEKFLAFQRKLFAAKSEARGSEQRDLFFNEAESLAPPDVEPAHEAPVDAPVAVAAHARQKRGRKPLDPALPREIVRHELPAAERVCPHDGAALVEIGVETSEQLDIIPQQVRVIQHQRVKYACPCCDQGIKVTPAPARIIAKGLLTESALAWVATAKYQDALPLYRQATLLARFGGELSRNTLAASMVRVGVALQPIINLLRDQLLDADIVMGDETTIQVLKEPGRAPQSKSYLWAQMNGSGPPVRLFDYAPGRGEAHAAQLYAGIRPGAVLMSDGYAVYNAIAQAHGLVHLGCWAHCRRYFVEAEAVLPKQARGPDQPVTRFLARIGELYGIEAKARDMTPEARGRLRQELSRPVLAHIQALLLQHLHSVPPSSLFGKALHYLHSQWPKLVRYVDNGLWPLDNNRCENAIRPFVIGRRNWLFADTVAGAKASANLYSLIETCKANQIEPYPYLAELFRRLPKAKTADDYEALLPWRLLPSATA